MPSIFDRTSGLAFGSALTVMAQEVIYQTADGGVCSLRGVFHSAYQRLEIHDGVEYSTVSPMLTVRLSDLRQAPAQGDRPTIADTEYEVINVQPDGHGGADLILRLVE